MWFIALALWNSCHLVSCDWLSHPRPHMETRCEGKPSEAEMWDGKKKSFWRRKGLFIYLSIYLLIYLFIKNDSHHLDYYFSFLKSLNAACFTNRRGFLWDFHMEIQIKTCRPLGLILLRLVRPFHRNTSGDTHTD